MKKSLILPLLAAGCATRHNPAGQQTLQQVRDQYMAGDYGDVIRTVATTDQFADAPQATLIEALKLQAFSYCLTRYTQLCEDDFVRILRMDPSFQLAPNEAGHPLWGPAFQHARQIVKGGAA